MATPRKVNVAMAPDRESSKNRPLPGGIKAFKDAADRAAETAGVMHVAPPRPVVVIRSARATRLKRNRQGTCGKCGDKRLLSWHYANTSHGPISICGACKVERDERAPHYDAMNVARACGEAQGRLGGRSQRP